MIQYNNRDINAIFAFNKDILKVYAGLYLVWPSINPNAHSCYGLGYWINDLPFVNEDPWMNF